MDKMRMLLRENSYNRLLHVPREWTLDEFEEYLKSTDCSGCVEKIGVTFEDVVGYNKGLEKYCGSLSPYVGSWYSHNNDVSVDNYYRFFKDIDDAYIKLVRDYEKKVNRKRMPARGNKSVGTMERLRFDYLVKAKTARERIANMLVRLGDDVIKHSDIHGMIMCLCHCVFYTRANLWRMRKYVDNYAEVYNEDDEEYIKYLEYMYTVH